MKKSNYSKKILTKRLVFGSLAAAMMVNQIPLQYAYVDRNVNAAENHGGATDRRI